MTISRIPIVFALLAASLAFSANAEVKVSQVPLAKAASQPVAPNLLFILDDSGSMDFDYTPDFVNDSLCRRSNSTQQFTNCDVGHPPFMSAGFNKQYYDPRIRYAPGVRADGASYSEMNSVNTNAWTKVLTNGYDENSSTADLVGGYTDIKWNGKVNSTYAYPDAINNINNLTTYSTGAYYYNLKPIYCTTDDATDCSKTKTGNYVVEVPYRWCKSGSFTNCKAKKDSTYTVPSFIELETGVGAVLKLTITGWTNKNTTQSVSSVKVNGVELLTGTASYNSGNSNNSGNNCTGLASAVVGKVSGLAQFTASSNSCVVTFTAKMLGTWANYTPSATATVTATGGITTSGVDGFAYFSRVNVVSTTPKYQIDGGRPAGRTDCTTYTDGCSGSEEMTNFANWYAYYSTRLKAMKSAASQAFKDIDNTFRVGFTQINKLSGNYVAIKAFDSTQRTAWYSKLLGASASGSTPLRGALTFAGRLFAGQKPSGVTDDPMQYSCQQNFALLTTDGYWNESSNPKKIDGTSDIGNQDGGTTSRPYFEGAVGASNSLADTAMYYYNTDLRTADLNNCTSSSTGADVCENNSPISPDDGNQAQHMVTYSLGLGVDGQLRYQKNYKTAPTGDFAKIKNGTLNWPKPVSNTETAVDDLWHAAVNGRGQYFSAQDPAVLVSSLKEALANISIQYGAGAAAATSTMEPVNGDNFVYVATYTTGKWLGNLESRTIDLSTGASSLQANRCAENIAADPTKNIVACTGTMAALVNATSDTRKIVFNSGGSLVDFTKTNLDAAGLLENFDVTKLNQYPIWTAEYKLEASAEKLINYLRGQGGYDTRDGNAFPLFRYREGVLGDFVGSAPKYVCKASATYADPGYSAFSAGLIGESGSCSRTPMIYIGGNDGMLHAFNGNTMEELWAFVPTPAISQMWRLADNTYGNNHRFFVDGPVTVGDVCTANCDNDNAVWKTILVAGLGAGVVQGGDPDIGAALSGYFALDVTNPAAPKFLWEITSATPTYGSKIGFALGKPWLAKVNDSSGNARWTVLFSSGFKPDNGGGTLFVVDAYSGNVMRSIDLVGGEGFSRFSPKFVKPGIDQTATRVYGGDLAGNVWRINPNDGSALKVLTGAGQPFTTAPELTTCNGKTSVYIGSGKFVEVADLTDKTPQSFYGFVDDYETVGTLTSPRSSLQQLTVTDTTVSASSSSGSPRGWYLDLPDIPSNGGAERVALVDPVLAGNILTFPSNIPESGVCLASGRSKLYQLPISTCSPISIFPGVLVGTVQSLGNSLVVGLTTIRLPDGRVKLIATGSDGSIKTHDSGKNSGQAPFGKKRVTWRELLRD